MKTQNEQFDEAFQTENDSVSQEQIGRETENAGSQKKKRSAWDRVFTAALAVAVCVLSVVLLLKLFVAGRVSVVGDSMTPNFVSGQTVWVNKRAVPERGDVVVFYLNDVNGIWAEFGNSGKGGPSEKYIKRVVALEGDRLWTEKSGSDRVLIVETSDGRILREDYYAVNGEAARFYDSAGNLCDIPYLGSLGNLADATQSSPYIVPQGCFYAMGDNRYDSHDSRAIGAVPYSRLYGVVI